MVGECSAVKPGKHKVRKRLFLFVRPVCSIKFVLVDRFCEVGIPIVYK